MVRDSSQGKYSALLPAQHFCLRHHVLVAMRTRRRDSQKHPSRPRARVEVLYGFSPASRSHISQQKFPVPRSSLMITSDQRTRLLIASATASLAGCCAYYRRRAHYIAALEQVLDFWFDPTKSSDDLYDQKWFVAANSQAQAALDEEVRKRFGSLLADASSIRLFVPSTARTTLALIVLLDQLSRHAFRSDRDRVESNDKLAIQLTQKLLAQGWEATLSTAELVFALMPLRHQPNEARLRDVLDRTAPALASCESGARLLQRFRKHTHLRLLHLEGKQGDPDDILEREDRERELDQTRAPTEPLARCVDSFLRQHCGVVPSADGRSDSASTNVSGARREQKARRREELMSKVRGGGDAAVDVEGHVPSAAASTDAPLTLIVSLSGGVDSMALVHILLALKAKHGYHYTVHAVHIDYANRRESAAEASFVREWCEARGVSIQVRVVEEVKRGITARDEYEKRSREIRFGEYERAMAATGGRGVFFGHHEGDGEQLVFPSLSVFSPLSALPSLPLHPTCSLVHAVAFMSYTPRPSDLHRLRRGANTPQTAVHENVISNVMKGAQLLDVAGISAASSVNGVLIFRPMLPVNKDVIYTYAHTYGVPYFKDSTPKWSTRGKLRNQLLPLLKVPTPCILPACSSIPFHDHPSRLSSPSRPSPRKHLFRMSTERASELIFLVWPKTLLSAPR